MPTSAPEVREQLAHALTLRDNPLTLSAELLDDFAAIGAFLTDEAACRLYLARLNNTLVDPLRRAKLVIDRKNVPAGESAFAVKTTRQAKDRNASFFKRDYFDEQIVKHHKVLTRFFAKWEGDAGFNVGTQQREGERLPPRRCWTVAAENRSRWPCLHPKTPVRRSRTPDRPWCGTSEPEQNLRREASWRDGMSRMSMRWTASATSPA